MIENIKYADMDQALTNLAAQEQAGHRRRRPDPGRADEDRQALPEGEVRDRRRQSRRGRRTSPATTCKQAEIAFVAGAAAAMLSKNGAVSYVGGLEIPPIVNAGKEFGTARNRSIRRSRFSTITPATSTTSPSPRRRRWRRSPRAPTSTTTSSTSACAAWSRRPRRRARTSSAATPTAAAPTRFTSPTRITGVGYLVEYAIDGGQRAPGSPATSRSAWRWARTRPAWSICSGAPEMKTKLEAIEKDILDGKIKVLEG